MDIFSILIFFVYALVILLILVYISPLLSAAVMIIVPVIIIFLLPDLTRDFLAIEQFSFVVPIHNIHIMLLVWSTFIGIIAYAEVLSWYLLREPEPGTKEKTAPDPSKPGEVPKEGIKAMDFLKKLIKLLRGQK